MPRGARPGERRGGRIKGTPNKVTADIREAAQKHGPAALKHLVHLMKNAEHEATQVSACKEVLDRAYGKSTFHADINVTREIVDVTDAELAAIAAASSAGASQQANGTEESPRLH